MIFPLPRAAQRPDVVNPKDSIVTNCSGQLKTSGSRTNCFSDLRLRSDNENESCDSRQ